MKIAFLEITSTSWQPYTGSLEALGFTMGFTLIYDDIFPFLRMKRQPRTSLGGHSSWHVAMHVQVPNRSTMTRSCSIQIALSWGIFRFSITHDKPTSSCIQSRSWPMVDTLHLLMFVFLSSLVHIPIYSKRLKYLATTRPRLTQKYRGLDGGPATSHNARDLRMDSWTVPENRTRGGRAIGRLTPRFPYPEAGTVIATGSKPFGMIGF